MCKRLAVFCALLIALLLLGVIGIAPGLRPPASPQSTTTSSVVSIILSSSSSSSSSESTSIAANREENSSSVVAVLVGASCFVPAASPADAVYSDFGNSTFSGDSITYANGTQKFYSYYSCPRPASIGSSNSSGSPDVYAMAVAAVTNSSFIAAENGSQFFLQQPSALGCGGETSRCAMALYFYQYGEKRQPDLVWRQDHLH